MPSPADSTSSVRPTTTPTLDTGEPAAPAPDATGRGAGNAALGRNVQTVSGLTLVSRVLGLARDMIQAAVFGTSAVGSAFAAAFAIPNTFRRLFGEGALSAAFLPEYARLDSEDPRRASALASLTLAGLAVATGLITVVLELALLAVLLLAPTDADRSLSLRLVMLLLPFMPLVSLAAILAGMLQAHGRFAPGAAAPIVLNTIMIVVGLPFALGVGTPAGAAYALGAGALLAAFLQILWGVWALRGVAGWRWSPADAREAGRRVLVRFGPAVLGLGTLQVNSLLDTLVAMWPIWVGDHVNTPLGVFAYPLDESSNAVLFYAQRLYQFPLGVFGVAVATAVFPALSRLSGDAAGFRETLARGLRLSLFIGLPASVGLALVSRDLVGGLFQGLSDKFTADGAERTAGVLLTYSLGVWAYSLNQVLTRAFYAAGDTRTPTAIAASMVLLNAVLNLSLIWVLREAGLAAATAISATLQMVLLLRAGRSRLPARRLLDAAMLRGVGRMALLSLTMGAVVLGVLALLPERETPAGHLAALGASVGIGGLVYAVLARLSGAPELRWLVHRGVVGPAKS